MTSDKIPDKSSGAKPSEAKPTPDEPAKKTSPEVVQPQTQTTGDRSTEKTPAESARPQDKTPLIERDDDATKTKDAPALAPPAKDAKPEKVGAATIHVPGAGRSTLTLTTESDRAHVGTDAYRRWLESKTKEDLIDLILKLSAREPHSDITEKKMAQIQDPLVDGKTFQVPENVQFVKLPVVPKEKHGEPRPTWRIILISIDTNSKPLGLDIDSEITVGRAAGEASPDLDLTPLGASSKGVSRIHAKIRPSADDLLLIDNSSTNGTFCNKSRLSPRAPLPLKDSDVIVFGKAGFVLKIVKSPEHPKTSAPPAGNAPT